MATVHADKYNDLNYTLWLDKDSGHWFYIFQYQWVSYRPNRAYATLEEAIASAHHHIDSIIEARNGRKQCTQTGENK